MCSVTQLCPTLCDPMDSSPPGPSVHGILQARILEWVAMPSSMLKTSQMDNLSPLFQRLCQKLFSVTITLIKFLLHKALSV